MVNKKDPRQNKNQRIIESLEKMQVGDTLTPTMFFKNLNIHPNTGKDMLDLYDSLKEINFEILRNSEGEIKAIIKTEEGEDSTKSIRKELDKIKKEIKNIQDAKK